ncbi:hypothetical protein L226DRAFT_576888 [Lentinus tigrinus ALCF2SS1-7]|uniref:uncharacterized protein n=1 Tax=Lentinus tigrinus ALCF2SS1-7 TaxID=1328758 RepID=UPI001165ECF5|nr:hypothetical protein L226DRAFT_576888 [Lentinus tigrinus ALCF2SS1-7]
MRWMHVELITAALSRALLEIKRTQRTQDKRMVRVEEEIKSIRKEICELMSPLKASYAKAEGEFRKQTRGIEDFQVNYSEQLDALRTSLGRVEMNVTTLQSRWETNRQSVDDFDMEECEEGIWSVLKEMREGMHKLTHGEDGPSGANGEYSPQPGSLAAEVLRASTG